MVTAAIRQGRAFPRGGGSWGRSCSGGHVGGQDVVGVAVEVLASPVVPHRGAWIGMAGGDLDVPRVYSGIQHGRHEGVPEHVGCGRVIGTPADG